MNSIPKISIVVPCYNCYDFVDRAIESVFEQNFNNWELILVDNNSTDKTLSKLRNYELSYPDKITVLAETKKGAPYARNLGLSVAKGTWIQFLDADDAIDANKFRRQIGLIEKFSPDVILSKYCRVVRKFGFDFKIVKTPNYKDPWMGLIEGKCGITSSNLYKKSILNQVGGWTEGLTSSQETNLLFKILKNNVEIIFDTETAAFIYFESDSISRNSNQSKNESLINNYVQLRLKIKEYLIESGKITPVLNRAINKSIYSYLIHKADKLQHIIDDLLTELNLDMNKIDCLKVHIKSKLKKIIGQ